MNRLTIRDLQELKQRGEKIASLTAYDASFARVLDEAGIEIVLVGDSLGNVLHGRDTTLGVSVDDMVYHTLAVSRATRRAHVVADMPFMSYAFPQRACENAARLMGDAGAQMVKIEGAGWVADIVSELAMRGVPVCGHLGLTPQWVHKFGGYRVQGREPETAKTILSNAQILVDAGIELLVLECVPADLAEQITGAVSVPVIGIGAGSACDGQVLVLHDVLGVSARIPRMAKNFLSGVDGVQDAVRSYIEAVKSGQFPAADHTFE